MAKKGEQRLVIHFACTQCQERTYTSEKNNKNDSQRIEIRKFCPRCRAHTPHRETK